jgi:type I restriction enzyme S subunit
MSEALGHVCTFLNGGTPSTSVPRYFEGTIPWITGADIVGPTVESARSFITEEAIQNSATNRVPAGTVLLVTRTSVGKVAVAGTALCFSQDITALIPNPQKLDTSYLVQFLHTKVPHFERLSRGATIKGITREVVADLPVLLPPLPEQRRIAEILDRAEEIRAKRRAALAQLDTLIQAIFLDLFGDPTTNQKEWSMIPFGGVCESRLGKMLDQKQQTGKHLRPYLRNANVQWFHFDLTTLFEMDFDASAREEFRLRDGDLLICEGGEPGRAAIWRGQVTECYYQKALHRVRPNKTLANPAYLAWLLFFLSNMGGLGDHVTSATIAHLTGEKLKAMRIPVPPIDLQRKFACRVAAVEKLKAAHRASLAEMDALFASLQHRAFRGEL